MEKMELDQEEQKFLLIHMYQSMVQWCNDKIKLIKNIKHIICLLKTRSFWFLLQILLVNTSKLKLLQLSRKFVISFV